MSTRDQVAVVIDPTYPQFYQDGLFDLSNPVLNRDGQLIPLSRLRDRLQQRGMMVHSADFLLRGQCNGSLVHYYSLGLRNYRRLPNNLNVAMRAFVIMEPPVVAPHLYSDLPSLTPEFEAVYLPNPHGDSYSLEGVDRSKLRRFFWPLPYPGVLEPYWSEPNRFHKLVVINGNHNPRFRPGELYTKRIEAMVALSRLNAVDLYGQGWDKLWSLRSMFLPYLLNRRTLLAIYKGPCRSKYEVLSRYRFCLCLENQSLDGYITEKLFDCMYAGTVPFYFGARDIAHYIPPEAFVDVRQFSSWEELWQYAQQMSPREIERIREAGRAFFEGAAAQPFHKSFDEIFIKCLD